MGKKTLEEIGKILLTSIISILVLLMTSKKALLNGKLDKSEYQTDQEYRESEHAKLHEIEFEMSKNTNEKVNWLYQNEIQKGR